MYLGQFIIRLPLFCKQKTRIFGKTQKTNFPSCLKGILEIGFTSISKPLLRESNANLSVNGHHNISTHTQKTSV